MKDRKKNYKVSLQNSIYLQEHFTSEYIRNMTDPKEYVVGFGAENKSFCYLVEVGTKELGDIRGATSSKFGLWYGTHGNDKNLKYRATKQYFNNDVNDAFTKLKTWIADLINEVIPLTEFKEIKSNLSPMFKYKIMYLYNNKIMLPCFVLKDIQYFEDCLSLPVSKTFLQGQKELLKYRKEKLSNLSNYEFMIYLYETYGKYNVSITKEQNDKEDAKLNKKLENIKSISENYVTHPVDKVKLKKGSEGVTYYPRDPKVAALALNNANFKCESNESHECFLRRSNNLPYTEVHHLIPLAYHYKFDKSLDIPENIISLCSNCHNEIHYGKDADEMIKKFYNLRKDKLKKAGINLSLDELLKMYHKIGNINK